MMKKVLVIGGTGTMGRYLCPILAEKGYEVHAIAGEIAKDRPGIRYFFANALDNEVLKSFLEKRYDAVIDFMWYHDLEVYKSRYQLFLEYTDHYFALSSYRVYADSELPITEESPRLAEALDADDEWRFSTGYAQSKCGIEDLLKASDSNNWTILRPTVVYCPGRMPLVAWSKNEVLLRAYAGKKIVIPREALDKKTSLLWGEDAAKMIAGLLFLPEAKREIYTLGSAETMTWGEILEFYHETYGLEAELCGTEEYLDHFYGDDEARRRKIKFMLCYDRLYNRVIDNSKVLKATGLRQCDFMPIRKGLTLASEGILPEACLAMDQFSGENQR